MSSFRLVPVAAAASRSRALMRPGASAFVPSLGVSASASMPPSPAACSSKTREEPSVAAVLELPASSSLVASSSRPAALSPALSFVACAEANTRDFRSSETASFHAASALSNFLAHSASISLSSAPFASTAPAHAPPISTRSVSGRETPGFRERELASARCSSKACSAPWALQTISPSSARRAPSTSIAQAVFVAGEASLASSLPPSSPACVSGVPSTFMEQSERVKCGMLPSPCAPAVASAPFTRTP